MYIYIYIYIRRTPWRIPKIENLGAGGDKINRGGGKGRGNKKCKMKITKKRHSSNIVYRRNPGAHTSAHPKTFFAEQRTLRGYPDAVANMQIGNDHCHSLISASISEEKVAGPFKRGLMAVLGGPMLPRKCAVRRRNCKWLRLLATLNSYRSVSSCVGQQEFGTELSWPGRQHLQSFLHRSILHEEARHR